jgi:hypothetical protein
MNNYLVSKEENGTVINVAFFYAPSYAVADAALHQAIDPFDWDRYALEEINEAGFDSLPTYSISLDNDGNACAGGEIVSHRNLPLA